MVGFQGESSFGMVIVILLLLVVIIGFVWLELIEKPRERKENQAQFDELKKKPDLLDSAKNLVSHIDFFRLNVLPCKKCGQTEFTIWDIQPSVISIRCNQCKKKCDYSDSDLKEGFVQSLIFHHNLFLDLVGIKNPLLEKYKKVPFDISSLRKNQPVFQAYIFQSKGAIIKADEEVEESNKGNRRVPRTVQDQVWRRDEGKCVLCGSNEKLEFDHIIPFSKGGSNTYRNIQLLCENCNRVKSSRIG